MDHAQHPRVGFAPVLAAWAALPAATTASDNATPRRATCAVVKDDDSEAADATDRNEEGSECASA
jgi:hypothetical protein